MTPNIIITTILGLAFPKLPRWAISLIISLFNYTMDAVREVEDAGELTGAEKFKLVSDNVEQFLSRETREVPGWSRINRRRRAKLVGGVIELAVFLVDISDGKLDMSNTRPGRVERVREDIKAKLRED